MVQPGTADRGPRNPPRAVVAEMLEGGKSITTIAEKLGLAKSTVCYHARRLGFLGDERFARRYDWAEIQRYYDDGHSIRACARRYGFCLESWHRAVRAGLLVSRPAGAPIETYLVKGRRTNRSHLKQRILAAGLKENRCERCGIEEWLGEPISMALHHINGDRLDNRLENVSLLCPNCHSQTPNFSGRNVRKRRLTAKPYVLAPCPSTRLRLDGFRSSRLRPRGTLISSPQWTTAAPTIDTRGARGEQLFEPILAVPNPNRPSNTVG